MRYISNNEQLIKDIESAIISRKNDLNLIAEQSTPDILNKQLKKTHLHLITEKEKLYMLQNKNLNSFTMNQIINNLDPATRKLIRGNPFIIPETDERMHTISSEQRMKIELLKNYTGEISRTKLKELLKEVTESNKSLEEFVKEAKESNKSLEEFVKRVKK